MNEEQREEFMEKLCETIVEGMSLVELKNIAWDHIYGELITASDPDLKLFAEDYGVRA